MTNNKIIAVLAGDGIGEEVMQGAITVLNQIEKKFNLKFELKYGLVGGAAFDKYNSHFPEETLKLCKESSAILFGSIGGPVNEQHLPKWHNCERNSILAIRKAFNFSVNLRPAKVYHELINSCPLKPEIAEGVDILIVRELIGDIYFGKKWSEVKDNKRHAYDIAEYNEDQIACAVHAAFKAAKNRAKRVTSVDKANVLETSRLWRTVAGEIAGSYPDIQFDNMLVDNCAMQLIKSPKQFDVIVTSNMFGDILSDEASVLPGSLGLTPSASLNSEGFGLYEPSGGSAPDIAGKDIANPIAQILSLAMMLKFSFQLEDAALSIENAVNKVIAAGYRTKDIYQENKNLKLVGTREMAKAIADACYF